MDENSRKYIIAGLLVMIIMLAAVSAFIAFRLRGDESAQDSLAQTGGCCLDNCLCTCWDGVGNEYRDAHCRLCKNQKYDSEIGACVDTG